MGETVTGWRYFEAASVGPVAARLFAGAVRSPADVVVLRCFACDWGYTVAPGWYGRNLATAVAAEHAAEHEGGAG